MIHNVVYWCLDQVPIWFRSRWPLRRFYWQAEDLEALVHDATSLAEWMAQERRGGNPWTSGK